MPQLLVAFSRGDLSIGPFRELSDLSYVAWEYLLAGPISCLVAVSLHAIDNVMTSRRVIEPRPVCYHTYSNMFGSDTRIYGSTVKPRCNTLGVAQRSSKSISSFIELAVAR